MNPYRQLDTRNELPYNTDRILWQRSLWNRITHYVTRFTDNDIAGLFIIVFFTAFAVSFIPLAIFTPRVEKIDAAGKVVETLAVTEGWIIYLLSFSVMLFPIYAKVISTLFAKRSIKKIQTKVGEMILTKQYTPELWGLIYELNYVEKVKDPIALRLYNGELYTKSEGNLARWKKITKEGQAEIGFKLDLDYENGIKFTNDAAFIYKREV